VHGTRVTCPLHDWAIDLATGEAVAPDRGCTRRYPVRLEQGRVWLALPPESGRDGCNEACA
jgi:nitrite reductase (NADH) small subunit